MKRLVGDHYTDLMPYPPGKPIEETERELGISGITKLASNENPHGTSPKAVEAMVKAATGVYIYPDGNAFYLKQKICEYWSNYNIQPENIILGNGTNEVINMFLRAFILHGENAICPWPTFVMYRLGLKALNRQEISVPLTPDMRYDHKAIVAAVNENTKAIFIANPNNPIGTYMTKDEFEYILANVPEDVMILMDEAYFEYVTKDDYPNTMDYIGQRKRLMATRTFSKIYGIAGVRLGYGIADPEMIDYMNRPREPFNVNSLAQAAGIAALDDNDFLVKSRDDNTKELAFMEAEYKRLGLKTVPSVGNFILVDFEKPGTQVFERLLHKGIIVRPMGGYGLATHIRVTIGSHEQNIKLIKAIEEMLADWKDN